MNILCKKNELGKLLNSMQRFNSQDFDFYPKTWILPHDLKAFEQFVEWKREKAERDSELKRTVYEDPFYIVKPEGGCQGRGIFLARDYEEICMNVPYCSKNDGYTTTQNYSGTETMHCVVQEYIDHPLLIDKLKFDLRIYVLILGVDPPRIFLFRDGLARFATAKYRIPNVDNAQNMKMHLTNYSINKNSDNFQKNSAAVADFIGSKRSLKFVLRHLKNQCGADTVAIMAEIKNIIIKTVMSGQPHLSTSYKQYHNDDFENSLCFEILGLDIMIDRDLKPYLLEVNHAPSFGCDSPLDEKIKGQVIYDTLNLLGLTQKRKRNYNIINNYKRELRRFSSKKLQLGLTQKEQYRKQFDEIRN